MTELRPHSAKYNAALLPIMANMLKGATVVLDPMAGTGKIFQLNEYLQHTNVDVPSHKFGSNSDVRVDFESVIKLRKNKR